MARFCGTIIVNRTDEITKEDIVTGAGFLEFRKIGDEYFTLIEQCKDPKAGTTLLRGASKDTLNNKMAKFIQKFVNPNAAYQKKRKDATGDNMYKDKLCAMLMCPVTGLKMNGKFHFLSNFTSGKVVS